MRCRLSLATSSFLSTPSARRATLNFAGLVKATVFLSTPSARRATMAKVDGAHIKEFLSTPSARRATLSAISCAQSALYFYPRPPRGGRPAHDGSRVELDRFLSTPSARRATSQSPLTTARTWPISIHALREEGDQDGKGCRVVEQISIHALREEGDTRMAATGPK